MAKASWNGTIVALSATYQTLEGNIYFPPEAVKRQHLRPSSHTSICPWKGVAHYFDLVVDDHVNGNAAWFYPDPKPAAAEIKDHIAFWKGVSVEADERPRSRQPGVV